MRLVKIPELEKLLPFSFRQKAPIFLYWRAMKRLVIKLLMKFVKLVALQIFYKVDVSIKEQIVAAHEAAVKNFGTYEAAFNNSGISSVVRVIQDLDTPTFDLTMKTDAYNASWCMRTQIKHFIDKKIQVQ